MLPVVESFAVAWAVGIEGACQHARCRADGERRLLCAAHRFDVELRTEALGSPAIHALTLALPGLAPRVLVSERLRPELARGFFYHALGHILLDDRIVRACSYATGSAACAAAWRTSLALAIPLEALDAPRARTAADLGLPAIWLDAADLVARQHGTRPGGVTRDELASAWLSTIREVKWLLSAPPALRARRGG